LADGDAYLDSEVIEGGDGPVIMQYSGLRDKEGTEIWSGDIIDFKGQKLIVEFFDSAFQVMMDHIFNDGRDYVILRSLNMAEAKVLGNIFENEELILFKAQEELGLTP
jgi:hypothetical protein